MFKLHSQRNAVSWDDCGTCVHSCRHVSPCHSVLCSKEMLFHPVISKQGIFLILNFQGQQSQLTLETNSRLWKKIWLWHVLYLRGLELLIFQHCFNLHEFTQWVISAHRKISHIGSISCNESTNVPFTKNCHSGQKHLEVLRWLFVIYWHSWWGWTADCGYPEHWQPLALLLQATNHGVCSAAGLCLRGAG